MLGAYMNDKAELMTGPLATYRAVHEYTGTQRPHFTHVREATIYVPDPGPAVWWRP